jgi:type II secretory pathway pseudopilin PulG
MGTWIKLGAVVIVAVLAASVFFAWRDARREQAALQAELKTTQQALAEATARQASRDAAVNDLVAGLKKKEAAVQKPAQVVAALPDVITLPAPITIDAEWPASDPSASLRAGDGPYTGKNAISDADRVQPKVNFPAGDLKPLYDFALECKACQAKLAAAQGDLADEKVKSQALGRERDDALRAAKGGSVLRRIARAAKWFAIGAAAGAIAAKAAR